MQSQIYPADEIIKKLQPEDEYQSFETIPAAVKGALDDVDEKFMQHNGISKINGMKCRTDLEQFVGNIPAAVKGALDDIDEKFIQHNGISKIVDITSRYEMCAIGMLPNYFFRQY